METILKLEHVSKVIDKKTLVSDLSFEIKAGEIFGFLGPNGAGKTTTIKMITGLFSITKGDIYICGTNVKQDFETALSNVGAIIENPEMYGHLSGKENLKQYARMHGKVDMDRINELVKFVKLEENINKKVSKYSLGMRQRLGLAQALMHEPRLIILDEPTNGLDPMGIKELRDILKHLTRTKGVSVLVSSHLLSEMELMCDRFGIIDKGILIDLKTKEEISENKEYLGYVIETSDNNKAMTLLNTKYETSQKEDKLIIMIDKKQLREVLNLLDDNDVDVYQFSQVKKSLEDEFLDIFKQASN